MLSKDINKKRNRNFILKKIFFCKIVSVSLSFYKEILSNKRKKWILISFLFFILSVFIIFQIFHKYQNRQKSSNQVKTELLNAMNSLNEISRINQTKILEKADQVIKKATIFEDTLILANALYLKLNAFYELQVTDSIISYRKQISDIAENLKNDTISIKLYNILGHAYLNKSDYVNAMNCYIDALRISEELQNFKFQAIALNGLGILYGKLGDFDMSISYLKKAISLFEILMDTNREGIAKLNLANSYEKKREYFKASEYSKQAIEIFRQLKDTNKIISAKIALSNIILGQDNDTLAVQNLKEAIVLSQQTNNYKSRGIAYYNLGSIYSQNGELELAEDNLIKSLEIFTKIGDRTGIMRVYGFLYKIERDKGKWEKSLNNYEKYTKLRDSIMGSDVKKEISNLKANFELMKMEQEADLFQQQLKFKKKENLFLVIALISVVIITILIGGFIRLAYKNLKKSEQIKVIENKQILEKAKADNIINKLEKQKLQVEIAEKNKKMVAVSLQLVSKNEVLKEMLDIINQSNRQNYLNEVSKSKLINVIRHNLSQEKDWLYFREMFEQVNTGFFNELKKRCQKLTENELRHCAYIKINLNTKEIAQLFNITPDSVKTSRYRIRKKLNLSEDIKLGDFIRNL